LAVKNFVASNITWKSWYKARSLCFNKSITRNCTISTGIPNLGVWHKKWSNWTSGVGVGQKNSTPTPSAARNPTPTPPKNLRLLTTPQSCCLVQIFLGKNLHVKASSISPYWNRSIKNLFWKLFADVEFGSRNNRKFEGYGDLYKEEKLSRTFLLRLFHGIAFDVIKNA